MHKTSSVASRLVSRWARALLPLLAVSPCAALVSRADPPATPAEERKGDSAADQLEGMMLRQVQGTRQLFAEEQLDAAQRRQLDQALADAEKQLKATIADLRRPSLSAEERAEKMAALGGGNLPLQAFFAAHQDLYAKMVWRGGIIVAEDGAMLSGQPRPLFDALAKLGLPPAVLARARARVQKAADEITAIRREAEARFARSGSLPDAEMEKAARENQKIQARVGEMARAARVEVRAMLTPAQREALDDQLAKLAGIPDEVGKVAKGLVPAPPPPPAHPKDDE